jgi:hypothetical protein
MFINNILIIAKMRLNLTNLRIEMYHVEGPMLKAPVAPVPLMVSCSKSLRSAVPRTSTGKQTIRGRRKKDVGSHQEEASSHEDAP